MTEFEKHRYEALMSNGLGTSEFEVLAFNLGADWAHGWFKLNVVAGKILQKLDVKNQQLTQEAEDLRKEIKELRKSNSELNIEAMALAEAMKGHRVMSRQEIEVKLSDALTRWQAFIGEEE